MVFLYLKWHVSLTFIICFSFVEFTNDLDNDNKITFCCNNNKLIYLQFACFIIDIKQI
jgi:hypothetical protein